MLDFRPILFILGILLTTLSIAMFLPALVDAALYGHPRVLEILHGAGANLEATTNLGSTALRIAALPPLCETR